MSSGPLMLALAALAITAVEGRAQTRQAAERRLDSLTAVLGTIRKPLRPQPRRQAPQAASAAAATTSATPVRINTLDTVDGPIRIIAASGASALAKRAAPAVHARLRAAFGGNPPSLVRHPIYVWLDTSQVDPLIEVFMGGLGIAFNGGRSYTKPDSAGVVDALLETAGFLIPALGGARLDEWLGHKSAPFDTLRDADWVRVSFDVSTLSYSANRKCLEGALAVCMTALDLVPPRDTLREWIDSANVMRIANNMAWLLRRESTPEMADRCVRGSIDVCAPLFRQHLTNELHPPMPMSARASLAQFAIATGGEGAATRLIKTEASIAVRLAVASGIPPESLVVRWRSRVLGQRAGSSFLNGEVIVAALVWTFLFAALGLRSSRWR